MFCTGLVVFLNNYRLKPLLVPSIKKTKKTKGQYKEKQKNIGKNLT